MALQLVAQLAAVEIAVRGLLLLLPSLQICRPLGPDTPSSVAQVRYLEAVDAMARQLVARLAALEAAGRGRFAVCVTGDHSTPVVFGDHSHEPVPLALAHVRRARVLMCMTVSGQGFCS